MKKIFMKNNSNFLIITTPSFKKEWQKEIKSISKRGKFLFIEDVGYSSHKVFGRRINEWIICATKK